MFVGREEENLGCGINWEEGVSFVCVGQKRLSSKCTKRSYTLKSLFLVVKCTLQMRTHQEASLGLLIPCSQPYKHIVCSGIVKRQGK